jgi:hypothetical protein
MDLIWLIVDKMIELAYLKGTVALLNSPMSTTTSAFSFELQAKFANGGETASTGTKKLRLHTELLSARKNDGTLNIIADDYEYALAA